MKVIYVAISKDIYGVVGGSVVCCVSVRGLANEIGVSESTLKRRDWNTMDWVEVKGWKIKQVEVVRNKPRGKNVSRGTRTN